MTAKLTITPLDNNFRPSLLLRPVTAQFNPTSYSISKAVTWQSPYPSAGLYADEMSASDQKLNAPILVFGGGSSRVLDLELFFDVTEGPNTGQVAASVPLIGSALGLANDISSAIAPQPRYDVRELTNGLVKLTRINRGRGQEDPPPICRISWGTLTPANSDFPFTGVVTDLRQNFTLFSSDGRPLRALVNVQFREYLDIERDQIETDPEVSTYVVKRGDTLSSIAAEVFDDPNLWRVIAQTNRLNNPRQLTIGATLTIPKQ